MASIFLNCSFFLNTCQCKAYLGKMSIDAALRIQQNPLPKRSLRIESLRKFRVVQETMMIVYPESSDIEHIRAVGKGEILAGYYKNHDKEDYVAIVDDDELGYVPTHIIGIFDMVRKYLDKLLSKRFYAPHGSKAEWTDKQFLITIWNWNLDKRLVYP